MNTFIKSMQNATPRPIPVHNAPFGPVGTGRTNMWIKWLSKQVGKVMIIGQRGNKKGCFTVTDITMSWETVKRYDVAFHEDDTPKDIQSRLNAGEMVGDANTIYITVPGTYKYLEVGLAEFLVKHDMLVDTLHSAPVAV